jgi:hypothetical protein
MCGNCSEAFETFSECRVHMAQVRLFHHIWKKKSSNLLLTHWLPLSNIYPITTKAKCDWNLSTVQFCSVKIIILEQGIELKLPSKCNTVVEGYIIYRAVIQSWNYPWIQNSWLVKIYYILVWSCGRRIYCVA